MVAFTEDANSLDTTIAYTLLIISLPPSFNIIRGERTRLRYPLI